jgi:hypothetical protein
LESWTFDEPALSRGNPSIDPAIHLEQNRQDGDPITDYRILTEG